MYRIDDATASTTLPTPETAGTEGYFSEGNPVTGTPATKVRGSWMNMIQEELRAIVVAAGLTPSKTTYNQVLSAIKALVPANAPGRLLNVQPFATSGTYTPTAGVGTVIMEVQGAGGGSGGAPATGAGGFSGSPGAPSGTYAMVKLTAAQIGASQSVTIGSGGTAGPTGAGTGGTGGTTSVGSLVSCPGGVGSTSYGPTSSTVVVATAPSVSAAPTVNSGSVIISSQGNVGSPAVGTSAGGVISGPGGSSPINRGTNGPGAGGAGQSLGASSSAIPGLVGGVGKVIFWEYA
ncbi:hypothetical protein [Paraburkholderia tropica]|uniref:hypothetical protein n=1 Tax=Paraburkholderia tropica TaxID=92647 RepID=UPI00160189CB|nr:hypothetical protein [Paraburkholderia tropica]